MRRTLVCGPSLGALMAASCVWLAAHDACAQECNEDADCPSGYTCQTFEGGGCSVGPCTPDGECPPPVCDTIEYRLCANAPCQRSADCPAGMVCYAPTYYACSGGGAGCRMGEDCPDWDRDPICEEVTGAASCVPQYVPPCQIDEDCGPGFSCREETSWSCGGGGAAGTGGFDPGAPTPPPEEPACVEEPSGRYHCQLQELPCDSDAQCPSGFTCETNPSSYGCGGTGGTGGGVDPTGPTGIGDGPFDVDFGCGPDPALPARVCLPPGYGGGPGVPGGGTGGSGGWDDGTSAPPGDGPSQGGGGTGGGDTDSSGPGESGNAPGKGKGRGKGKGFPWPLPGGGCSVSESHAASETLGWIGLVGLLGIVMRRRTGRRG